METQGEFFADKLMDLANLAAAALIFGQLLEGPLRWKPVLTGLGLLPICVVISYWLRRKKAR